MRRWGIIVVVVAILGYAIALRGAHGTAPTTGAIPVTGITVTAIAVAPVPPVVTPFITPTTVPAANAVAPVIATTAAATQNAVRTALAAEDKATATIRLGPPQKLTVSTNLEDVSVSVAITNGDTVTHTLSPQADFYSVPADQVSKSNDPANFEVTAGYITLSLAPGETQNVTIHAKNFNHEPVRSASIRATNMK